MKSAWKITAAIACGLLVGGGAVQLLHAQSKPPAYVVAEVAVKDKEGFEENFLKATKKDIADHGGKYLAGGYNKTLSLSGAELPNRVVIVQFANMDAVRRGAIRAPWTWRTPSAARTPSFVSMQWRE
jgi:uncharacterized protein (DUF1330 family)